MSWPRAAMALAAVLIGSLVWFACSRQPAGDGILVSLRIAGGLTGTIERGDPVLFEVLIRGGTDDEALALGSGSRPWPRAIALRFDNGDDGMPQPDLLSPPRGIALAPNHGEPPTVTDDASVARTRGRSQLYAVELGLSPEASAALRAGTYQLSAAIEAGGWWRSRRLVSTPVVLTVVEPAPANAALRLERAGTYYARVGRLAEAEQAARDLLGQRPDDPAGHVILGDVLRRSGHLRDARTHYLDALQEIRESERQFYEEPSRLFERIREVERQLAGK